MFTKNEQINYKLIIFDNLVVSFPEASIPTL